MASLDSLVHPHQMEVQEFSSYALVIDARSAEAYQEDHLPGAVNVPVAADRLADAQFTADGTWHRGGGWRSRTLDAVPLGGSGRAALTRRHCLGLLRPRRTGQPGLGRSAQSRRLQGRCAWRWLDQLPTLGQRRPGTPAPGTDLPATLGASGRRLVPRGRQARTAGRTGHRPHGPGRATPGAGADAAG
ncbi:MAG: rhodanese-like domain-containing protein [Piscinibacter sp.]|nr:rhodanese-like domain-containing protein [Piscinibacter sp.]